MKRVLLVKYGEISLRKGNRRLYEQRLIDTLRRHLRLFGGDRIHVIREQGRIVVEDTGGDIDLSVLPAISRIFGIIALCPCLRLDTNDLDIIKKAALQMFGEHPAMRGVDGPKSIRFKVDTRRADKQYPLPSQTVSAAVGAYLLEQFPELTVDLQTPDITLWIELRTFTYLYTQWAPGEAGLPYGSSGKGILLLSGGIDSPVAGYWMARRGVEIVPVYFHSPPYTSERAKDKVVDITRRLASYTDHAKLYVVPFTDIQMYLYGQVPREKLTLLLKRAMLRLAGEIAGHENAHCLITGDSVGQVASQTILGLAAVHSASPLPVLRPLAGVAKQAIIDCARQIGTYDISIRPYDDCCTLFVAEHPENKPNVSVIEKIEARLTGLPDLCAKAVADAETLILRDES